MQTREKANPFLDLHNFEKEYQHHAIKRLLYGYFNETELFPLLEYVDVSYKNQTTLCDWNEDVIQPIETLSDENLTYYHNAMSSVEAASTLEQQIYFYNHIFNDLLSISSHDFDYFLLLGKICGQLARCHFQLGNYEPAKMYQLSLVQIQIVCLLLEYKSIDGLDIAESFNYLGVIFCQQKMYELSHMCYQYALTAIEYMSNQQSSLIVGELHYNIGALYFIQSGVQTCEENQELFSEQELEDKQRLSLHADHYFMIALKYGVPSEKIEPKRKMIAEAIQKEKAIAQLMEGTVQAAIERLYKEKLKHNILPTSLSSISEVEELPEENSIFSEEISKQNSQVSKVDDSTQSSQSSKNCNAYSSPRRPTAYFLVTCQPARKNYRPLLQIPFAKNTITLLPTPKSHYYKGSSAFFFAGSLRAQSQSSKSDNRNAKHVAVLPRSNV